jgi:peptidoglycan/LPS O-acetylase OafA/YrhL
LIAIPRRSPPTGPDSATGYIPALNGIRAVAVIVTMGFHGGVFFTAGGFYGVDAFFTLSGFLITGLLLGEWERTSTIRLGSFWVRRARRLLPALFALLLVVALSSAFLVPSGTYPDLRGDGLSALLYFANWHFLAVGSNYFGQTGVTSPFTHLWSLAVEEQFYVVWPLAVLGLLYLTRRKVVLLIVCIVGTLASAAEMALLYTPADVNRLYYGTDTRAQSLLMGAALAVALSLWSERPRESSRFPWHRAVAVVGWAGAVGCVVLWTTLSGNDPLTYRGGFFLAALATSAVLLGVVRGRHSLLSRFLSSEPLVYLGTISYGLYLWHFPVFLFLDNARTGLTGYPLFVVRVATTLALSIASFHGLENPIRRGTFLRGVKAMVLSPLAVVAVIAAVFASTPATTFAVRTSATSPTLTRAMATAAPPSSSASRPLVRVLWVGDSTALTLGIALSDEQGSYGVESLDAAIVGCGFTNGAEFEMKGVDAPMPPQCSGAPGGGSWAHVWETDIALYRPNVVIILAGRWEVANRSWNGSWTSIDDPAYATYVRQQLEYAVQVAGSGGAHVIVMTAPCYDSGEQPNGDPWPEDSPRRLSDYNQIVRQVVAGSPDASVLDLDSIVCPDGTFTPSMDGVQIRQSDGVHFAFGSGGALAPTIWPQVVAAVEPPPPHPEPLEPA